MRKMAMELTVARRTAKSLGTYTAARYMAKRGWSLESALYWLAGAASRS